MGKAYQKKIGRISLSIRIVEEIHGGKLQVLNSSKELGTTLEISL